MSWSLTAYGNILDADGELHLMRTFRDALAVSGGRTFYATIQTQHHGLVDLVPPPPVPVAAPCEAMRRAGLVE